MITAAAIILIVIGACLWLFAIFGPLEEYAVDDFVRMGIAILGATMLLDGAWGLVRLYG